MKKEPTPEQVAARSPKSRWHPEAGIVWREIKDHIPADKAEKVIESFVIARESRCLQPPGGARSIARIGQLWEEISGAKQQRDMGITKYALGAGAGLLGGLVLGFALSTSYEAVPPMAMAVAGAAAGAAAAHFMRGSKRFLDCMLQIYINERRSVVRKEMVTDQCEFWVPKAIMWHRQKEWRRNRKGATYMWLHLPFRARITRAVRNMVDSLGLKEDLFVMLDSAAKGQRVWNRMLAQNAEDFSHLDDGEEPNKPFEEIMPHLIGAAGVVGGIIVLAVVA